jgi:fructoselysine 6-kinase
VLLAIGDNCVDRYLSPIAQEHVGGNALNVAVNSALHGRPAAYAGIVGSDRNGERVLAALRASAVNTECVRQAAGSTGVTEIALDGRDYRIISETYGVSDLLAVTTELLEFASWIHLTMTGRAPELIDALGAAGPPISVDLGSLRTAAALQPQAALLSACETAFISVGAQLADPEVEALLLALRHLGAAAAVATRGCRGAASLMSGRLMAVPSRLAGPLVDPLGAGDAFVAGFLAAVQTGSDLHAQLECGSEWAAAACAHLGALPHG